VFLCIFSWVSTSAVDCLEWLVSKLIYYLSSWTSNSACSLDRDLVYVPCVYNTLRSEASHFCYCRLSDVFLLVSAFPFSSLCRFANYICLSLPSLAVVVINCKCVCILRCLTAVWLVVIIFGIITWSHLVLNPDPCHQRYLHCMYAVSRKKTNSVLSIV